MGMGRREFLGAAAGLAVGAAAGPAFWNAGGDLVRMRQAPPWLPGLPRGPVREIASMSLACPSHQGVRVLLGQGGPFLVRGDPEHPLSLGAVTPPAQAEARARFHPDRVRTPLLKNGQGVFEPVSWAAALDLLVARLVDAGDRVMSVGPAEHGTLDGLLTGFMAGLGSGQVFRMPSEAATARAAASLMGGSGQPGYDLHNARGLVLIGADIFESMPASPHFRKAWGARRDAPSTFLGPVRGASAALCLDYVPLSAGEEALLAMGVAWHLADMGRIDSTAPDLMDFLDLARQRFSPEDVLRVTGLGPDIVRGAAQAVAAGALAVPGSSCGEGLGLAPLVAGYALSVITGGVNRPGGVFLTKEASGRIPGASQPLDLAGRLKDLALGLAPPPAVLLLAECDPAGEMPSAELAARAVARAPFKTVFTALVTPSARLCDLILPAPMPLERFGDAFTPYGQAFASYGLARPLARPLGSARHPGDVLLELAGRLGRPLGPSSFLHALRGQVSGLESMEGYVVRSGSDAVMPWRVLAGQAQPAPEAGLWRELLEGRAWVRPEPAPAQLSCGAKFLAEALIPEAVDLNLPLKLAPQSTWRKGLAGYPGPAEAGAQAGADAPEARVNAATAREARAGGGDKVRIAGPAGAVQARLAIDESVMDGHLALDLGRGEGQGGHVRQVESFSPEPGSGASVWAGCRVSLERS